MQESPQESAPSVPTPTPEEKGWLMGLHLSPLAMFTSIPFANVIAPLVIWLIKKDQMPALNVHGKEVVNFQLSIAIYAIVGVLLVFFLIGIPVLVALFIFNLIMIILGTVDANNGVLRRFPLSIRFIK